jgi:hypothetical protein
MKMEYKSTNNLTRTVSDSTNCTDGRVWNFGDDIIQLKMFSSSNLRRTMKRLFIRQSTIKQLNEKIITRNRDYQGNRMKRSSSFEEVKNSLPKPN